MAAFVKKPKESTSETSVDNENGTEIMNNSDSEMTHDRVSVHSDNIADGAAASGDDCRCTRNDPSKNTSSEQGWSTKVLKLWCLCVC